MRAILVIIGICVSSQLSPAQTSFELSVPVGISTYTPSTLSSVKNQLPPENYQFKKGVSLGFNARLVESLTSRLEIVLLELHYQRLQQRTVLQEQRNSYSWTSRDYRFRVAEHQLGGGISLGYALFQSSASSLKTRVKLSIMGTFFNEGWVSLEETSFFEPETEHYSSYLSEYELLSSLYLMPGIGIVYGYEKGAVNIFAELGYSYVSELRQDLRHHFTPYNWNNIYFALGTGWTIDSSKD